MPKNQAPLEFNLQEALFRAWKHHVDIAATVFQADICLIADESYSKRAYARHRRLNLENILGYCIRWRSTDGGSDQEVFHDLTFLPPQHEIHYTSSKHGKVVIKNITGVSAVEGGLMLSIVSTKFEKRQ